MADIMVRVDDLRRYCEKHHCGSVPLEYIKQIPSIETEPVKRGTTNADRIRQMTNDEIAKMLDIYSIEEMCQYCKYDGDMCCYRCYDGILAWLNQEVRDDG